MRQQFFKLSLAVVATLLLPSTTFAETMSSQNYVIEQGAFTSGGGNSSSGSYSLFGSLGENYLSEANGSNFQLGGVAGITTTPTPAPSSSSSSATDSGDGDGGSGPGDVGPDPSTPASSPTKATSSKIPKAPSTSSETPSLITSLLTPITALFAPAPETPAGEEGAGADEGIPAQLFDIRLLLDRDTISRTHDLVARVEFTSFGREPTPVEMTFSLVDANGMELWSSVDTTTVQTEAIFVKRFTDINELPDGSYTLRLATLYSDDTRDTFEAPFTISSTAGVSRWVLWLIFGLATLMIVPSLFFLWRRRRDDDKAEQARF